MGHPSEGRDAARDEALEEQQQRASRASTPRPAPPQPPQRLPPVHGFPPDHPLSPAFGAPPRAAPGLPPAPAPALGPLSRPALSFLRTAHNISRAFGPPKMAYGSSHLMRHQSVPAGYIWRSGFMQWYVAVRFVVLGVPFVVMFRSLPYPGAVRRHVHRVLSHMRLAAGIRIMLEMTALLGFYVFVAYLRSLGRPGGKE